MNARKRAHFAQLLDKERQRRSNTLERIAATSAILAGAESTQPPGDEPTPGATGGAPEDDAAITAREAAALKEIEEALRLMSEEPDRYGICSICGDQIAIDRLEIVPATRFCERHAPV
jgi:RNA polymerase-binding transcription factor DksA